MHYALVTYDQIQQSTGSNHKWLELTPTIDNRLAYRTLRVKGGVCVMHLVITSDMKETSLLTKLMRTYHLYMCNFT